MFSQGAVWLAAQRSEVKPMLVRARLGVALLKGPPDGPTEVESAAGNTWSASGGETKALIKLLPEGEPQPVQRS